MTNHWVDIKNSDCVLILGSNTAENHPVFFRWAMKAREAGGKIIHVDPRFTRTSQLSDVYARIRPGTDIAFVGGLINYVLQNKLYHEFYVREYTNATYLVNPEFKTATELKGIFSGLKGNKYDTNAWGYQLEANGERKKDMTMRDPHSVFQLVKKHYSRYTVETVSKITGCDPKVYEEVCKLFGATGAPDKAGTIVYAMGITQHTYGTQNVRILSVLQLLLGNLGVAGGGINALRGESNVQGSTDFGLLFNSLPGYNPLPSASVKTLKDYNEKFTPKSSDPKSLNWQGNRPKYMVSMLKAKYGAYATKENDFAYDLLPKLDDGKNYSFLPLFETMYKGGVEGLFLWGMNPAVSAPNSRMIRKALGNLKWMVAIDLWETETAAFWQAPEADPKSIKTEVFLLPAAASFEKEGSVSNSGRMVQWRYKAVEPVGEARSDLDIATDLYYDLADAYTKGKGALPEAITQLTWNYGLKSPGGRLFRGPDPHFVAKEINGYAVSDITDPKTNAVLAKAGEQLPTFGLLQADGSTVCGCWIYCGAYTEKGNMMARRSPKDPTGIGLYPEWSWVWPVNRRILYNRASVDWEGKPFNTKKPVIWWDGAKWLGDVPDGAQPPGSIYPFIMNRGGLGRLYGLGLADGPMPEHYEPLECTIKNFLSEHQTNPVIKRWDIEGSDMSKAATYGSEYCIQYPFIATTYRITEHWQAGQMTRWLPWLAEAMPEPFLEISEELAGEKGIKNGEPVLVSSVRVPKGIQVKAVVTKRLKPMKMDGQTVHVVGLPWHWGFKGIITGPIINELTPSIGDANTMIPEYKAFLVNVKKGV
jgi:formate dehydrogenase-N alpha subunit